MKSMIYAWSIFFFLDFLRTDVKKLPKLSIFDKKPIYYKSNQSL